MKEALLPMIVIFWIAYAITLAEFTATSVNLLRGSEPHLRRMREIQFPLGLARIMARVQLAAVIGMVAGLWFPIIRLICGLVLAASFVTVIGRGLWAKRPLSDILAVGLFAVFALIAALY